MLKYEKFSPYDSSKSMFKFRKLVPCQKQNLFSCADTNRLYYVSIFTNSHHFSILHSLFLKDYFGNIKGFSKKKNTYYCFSEASDFTTLAAYIQNLKGQKKLVTELFCLQLVESIIFMAKGFNQASFNLKIINPHHIMVTQIRQDNWKFQLTYPLNYNLFQGLNSSIVSQQIQFCAPQILSKNIENNQENLNKKYFPKAVLYSLGLVLLFCFGYRIKGQQRRKANSKQFNIFLKAIRKEIKFLQQGKFISKLIKILMQENDYVRDSLQTFQLKLFSPHLQSLRKFRYLPINQPQRQAYIPTIYSDHSEQLHKSGSNRTIQIQGSSTSVIVTNNRSQNSRDGIELTLNQGRSLMPNFKKSTQSVVSPEVIKQQEQQIANKSLKFQAPSPIQIQMDWDDSDQETQKKSPKHQEKKETININYENLQFDQNDIQPQLRQTHKEDKKALLDNKQKNQLLRNTLRNSFNKDYDELHMKQLGEREIESKHQLNKDGISLVQNLQANNDYKVMVEEQPQIIKYADEDYKMGNSPKLSRKRMSRNSGDLQDMTLIQEQIIDEEDTQEPQSRGNNDYLQMREQFSQRSQAIFITLLIGFLIYKVVDFVIK